MTGILDRTVGSLMSALTARPSGGESCIVNDIHSRLNETVVRRVIAVRSVDDARAAIALAREEGTPICIAGGWHAMGGQQFAAGGILLDTRRFNRVVSFDAERGLIEVEAGMQWPELVDALRYLQRRQPAATSWGIAQKQTGADRLSIGGAVSANVHGRGLAMTPFVGDVESLTLLDPNGALRTCSRIENAPLFRLVVGGYGLFGFIVTVTLRLAPRRIVRRVVDVLDIEDLMPAFEHRINEGFLYGDFQFSIDAASDDFLRRGILSAYQPVPDDTVIPAAQHALSVEDWRDLLVLAHTDKAAAFECYASHYLRTTGQLYWSDTHQLSTYIDDYHAALDRHLAAEHPATEMIGELYVPRTALPEFMADAADHLRASGGNVIYGTVRLIERDDESFLPWARDRYACVIFNLHTEHCDEGRERAASDYRRLMDLAIGRGGSYYLTYHRWARRDQLLACYPGFPAMLRAKLAYDPEERFQSDWYRWYREMFSDVLAPGGLPAR
jgi:FAD/FMN-containing dehydrogenase